MDRQKKPSVTAQRRVPLGECQPQATSTSSHSNPLQQAKIPSTAPIPHHESLHPAGNLAAITRPNAPSSRAANNRVIAIAQDEADNKRDSQISTTSTISITKGKRKTHIGPWQLGRTLGKGASGRVRLAKHALTGQPAAVKIVSKKAAAMVQSASIAQFNNDMSSSADTTGNRTMPFGIEREIVVMKLIDHPNIMRLYDIWENRGELYLVLEHIEGGELFEYVMRNGTLPEHEAIRLLRQILAGLAYCHRFNICHRDLKPENLLLDNNHNIKIADFGMAALQPAGRHLTTSCGSPHYAAPEIVAAREYQGSQADVWSVGIILYAMLNGFLPFDGTDVHSTMRKVRKGRYYLSPHLSPEATDLIQRILQVNPDDRITIDDMWSHPLLRKYESLHRSQAPGGHLPGPPPRLAASDCGSSQLKASDIDRELLRHLQVLWHGLDEQEVIDRLTSQEPNYERLFYQALLKFREEQLENFSGDLLQYSTSDYHHVRRPAVRLTRSATKNTLHQRRISQFSIVSGDSIVRDAYYKNPKTSTSKTTQGSYDPYRASRTPITQSQKQGTRVVVDRPGTYPAAQLVSSSSSKLGLPRTISTPDVPSLDSQGLKKLLQQKRLTTSTASSHSSLSSSQRQRVFRKSTSYRRNVAFHHQNQRSNQDSTQAREDSPTTARSKPTATRSQDAFDRFAPSHLPTPELVIAPRRSGPSRHPNERRAADTPFKDVTRKASAELGKMCEDAFNRSSVSYASDLSQRGPVDSPATTVSAPRNVPLKAGSAQGVFTPTLRDLMERRKKIIETWGEADPQTLAAIVNTLDERITAEQRKVDAALERRAVSDPTYSNLAADYTSTMPDTMQELMRYRGNELRAASDPLKMTDNTIRMVTPDVTSPIARIATRSNKFMPVNSLKGGSSSLGNGQAPGNYEKRLFNGSGLKPILEDSPSSPKKPIFPDSRKWSWLGRKGAASSEDLPAPTPPRKDTPKEKQQSTLSSLSSISTEPRKQENNSDEIEARKRHWFQKVFGKRGHPTTSAENDHMVVQDDLDDIDSVDGIMTPLPRGPTRRGQRVALSTEDAATNSRPEASQNWFAKLLHLKPATSVLVLNVGKVHARKEIVRILREWRKFGIRDVEVEKRLTGDVVKARVDAANYLHIRPVQFFASVYTVLEKGNKVHLAIVKFTQEKGAASSFHRVVDTMESVLKENDLILLDQNKRKKIMRSMKQAGL